jgi:hypothetical protein
LKNVFVLRVNDYRPDLCRYTIPTVKLWASRIGARYTEITTRVFPEWPVTYEKLQVHRLGVGADWNILVDADFMLHPELPDFTETLDRNTVGMHYGFNASTMFMNDIYFERDGRDLGIAGGFVITSRLTHDLWTPLEFDWQTARQRLRREFIVDEYCLSRNLAKFGLYHSGVERGPEIAEKMIHIGNEEKTDTERALDVETARRIYLDWFGREPEE